MHRLTYPTLLAAACAFAAPPALAQSMKNPQMLPRYEQHHDFRNIYDDLESDANFQGTPIN